ncbi:hypothetical protein [Campylobacter devanensis]|uniref:hypothetical protein n=1 Tax=Campylobacter devanensis TaxID=3161138 RepID=UPI000A3357C5|nr:hypothetical protein [Campylobacter sp. P093]
MALKYVTMLIKDGNLSKDEIINSVKSRLSEYKAISGSYEYIAQVINPMSKESFCVVDDEFKEALNLDDNTFGFISDGFDDSELKAKLVELAAKIDGEIVALDELANYTTKAEFDAMVKELKGLFDQLLGEIQGILNKIRADISGLQTQVEAISSSGGIDENAINEAINNNANIQELGAKVNHLATNLQGATYAQLVATMKFLGYELPSELRAYADYNLYADDRLSGDLTIGFKPITYAGSYGQAWENVAIYNELGEKLTAKYANISSDGLNIEAIFAKDERQPKGDSWEPVPSDYILADGEVRVSITLGASSYYGATYGLRMLNNNPSSWTESYLAGNHSYDEWVFTFHNYKPTKFSITNGTATYGGYGYMTKYNMRLSIGNWSKTLTYENSSYPNNIEVDLTNLNFGSDAKTIELAKAWNIPVTPYDINSDMVDE